MDRTKFETTIRAFKNRKPFQSFIVALLDGDRFQIDHQDAVWVRDGVAVYLAPGGAPTIFDYEGVSQIIGELKLQES